MIARTTSMNSDEERRWLRKAICRSCGFCGNGKAGSGKRKSLRMPKQTVSHKSSGTNEVEGALEDDGGGGGNNLFDGGFGDDSDVAACNGLLESLEEGARLAEGNVGAEVSLDLSEEKVNGLVCFSLVWVGWEVQIQLRLGRDWNWEWRKHGENLVGY
ncbi:hypothetical protein RIF29_19854 [Crotalaria pallida]|uniref:Uncharacterized protein n=1 Tax=Crotalaria pallida TaxID=3830 RepID=A0AAN9I6X0_CROPI